MGLEGPIGAAEAEHDQRGLAVGLEADVTVDPPAETATVVQEAWRAFGGDELRRHRTALDGQPLIHVEQEVAAVDRARVALLDGRRIVVEAQPKAAWHKRFACGGLSTVRCVEHVRVRRSRRIMRWHRRLLVAFDQSERLKT